MMCDTAAIAINCIYYYLIGPTQAHPSTAWPFDYQHTLYYEISRSNGQLTLVYNSTNSILIKVILPDYKLRRRMSGVESAT